MNKRKDEEPEQRHSTDQEGKKQQPKRKLGKNLDKKEKKKKISKPKKRCSASSVIKEMQ